MNETSKAYIAGIIDGEGSIMLLRLHKNELPRPCVSIASNWNGYYTFEMLNDKQDFYTEFINNKMKNPRHFVVDLLVEAIRDL